MKRLKYPEFRAKEYLESKGVFGLDTKKRYNEVIGWMEEYAQEAIKSCSIPVFSASIHSERMINRLQNLAIEKCLDMENCQDIADVYEKHFNSDYEKCGCGSTIDTDVYCQECLTKIAERGN